MTNAIRRPTIGCIPDAADAERDPSADAKSLVSELLQSAIETKDTQCITRRDCDARSSYVVAWLVLVTRMHCDETARWIELLLRGCYNIKHLKDRDQHLGYKALSLFVFWINRNQLLAAHACWLIGHNGWRRMNHVQSVDHLDCEEANNTTAVTDALLDVAPGSKLSVATMSAGTDPGFIQIRCEETRRERWDRDAESVELQRGAGRRQQDQEVKCVDKRWMGIGESYPLPRRLGGLWERHKLPEGSGAEPGRKCFFCAFWAWKNPYGDKN